MSGSLPLPHFFDPELTLRPSTVIYYLSRTWTQPHTKIKNDKNFLNFLEKNNINFLFDFIR